MRVTIGLPGRRIAIDELSGTERRVLVMSIEAIWTQILRGASANFGTAEGDPTGRNSEEDRRSGCLGGDAVSVPELRRRHPGEFGGR